LSQDICANTLHKGDSIFTNTTNNNNNNNGSTLSIVVLSTKLQELYQSCRLRNVNHLSIVKSERIPCGSQDRARHLRKFSVPVFKINTQAVLSERRQKGMAWLAGYEGASYSTRCLAYWDELNITSVELVS
jgi:hypothetical protein